MHPNSSYNKIQHKEIAKQHPISLKGHVFFALINCKDELVVRYNCFFVDPPEPPRTNLIADLPPGHTINSFLLNVSHFHLIVELIVLPPGISSEPPGNPPGN